MNQFSSNYSLYWRQVSSGAGKRADVPGINVYERALSELVRPLMVRGQAKACLDIACGSGRLFDSLRKIAPHVDGVDIEEEALSIAGDKGYRNLYLGDFATISIDETYDFLSCWASFEVLDQQRALRKMNQLSTVNGLTLLSGKNSCYFQDDLEALEAERGARAKGFSQSFVRLSVLLTELPLYGFALEELLVFPRRGDCANWNWKEWSQIDDDEPFYEFVAVIRRTGGSEAVAEIAPRWSVAVSDTLLKADAR